MSHKSTTCALAATMLFGGTLGAAHAGVTGVAGNSSAANLSLAYFSDPYTNARADGSPMSDPVSFSDPTFGAISCSQFTSSGFALTIGSTAAANNQSFFVQQNFIVTGTVQFTLTGFLPVSSAGSALIEQNGTPIASSGSNAGNFSLTGTLQAGEYRFAYTSSATGATNGTLFNLTFSEVPAPGAIALLGAAGLVTGRRRR
jgi:MYXO-CTERM domain-containing protein